MIVSNGWEPARICEDCGLEEHHGSVGFHVLTGADVTRLDEAAALWKLRPVVGRALVTWCPGNRFYPGHPVVYERNGAQPVNGRCCVAHTMEFARAVLADVDAADDRGPATGEDRAAALARHEASHPPAAADSPRSYWPRVRGAR